jgi:hypothetical protein
MAVFRTGILPMAAALPASQGETVTAGTGRHDLAHDLVLPTLLFTALGGMTWAVRGCAGFGAVAGCTFAGVTWGAAWWYLAQSPDGRRTRRYDSGWIVLALTIGIGLSGGRGWMQWPSFFEGKLMTDAPRGEFVPISRSYGFLWLFLAGVPWAGIGACLLAWCGSRRETRLCHWVIRIACGLGGALLARHLITAYPQYFLPLYDSLEARYNDARANPNLPRLVGDCTATMYHMGFYLGFLLYEAVRKEWKNVVLILTVGLVNGAGWALCQNWRWAAGLWPNSNFNYWRCWESSGGLSIGIAYGIAYYLVNRRMTDDERSELAARWAIPGPNFEWVLIFLGLTWVLSLYARPTFAGWGNLVFSIVMLFGAVYYLLGRRSAANAASSRDGWVMACITAVLIAGLFLPSLLSPGRRDGRSPRTAGNPAALADNASRKGERPADGDTRAPRDPGRSRDPVRGRTPGSAVSNWRGWVYMYGSGLALALGCAWYLVNRSRCDEEARLTTPAGADPNLERLGLYLGLLTGLGLSVRSGLKGWFNIYMGNENYWDRLLWQYFGPMYLIALLALVAWVLFRPSPRDPAARRWPHAYGLMWLVLIVQNAIALLITAQLTDWNEMAFSIYYVLLFLITATIVFHFHVLRERAIE